MHQDRASHYTQNIRPAPQGAQEHSLAAKLLLNSNNTQSAHTVPFFLPAPLHCPLMAGNQCKGPSATLWSPLGHGASGFYHTASCCSLPDQKAVFQCSAKLLGSSVEAVSKITTWHWPLLSALKLGQKALKTRYKYAVNTVHSEVSSGSLFLLAFLLREEEQLWPRAKSAI